jgi:hypothetical protein
VLTAHVGKNRSLTSVGMTNGRGGDAANLNAIDRNALCRSHVARSCRAYL